MKIILLMVSTMFLMSSVVAEELPKDRYHFSVSARGQADNDWMVVVLSSQRQDKDLARASDAVNKEMAWALEQIEADLEIQSSTEGYSSNPVYMDKGREVRAWRVSQQLRLQSSNFDLLTSKLQKLQQQLSIQQMAFSVKPDTRDLLVEDLMVEALANFRRRAKLIAHQMDAVDFSAVNININSGGNQQQYARPAMMRSMSADMAAPAVAGGASDLVVSISAEIELQY